MNESIKRAISGIVYIALLVASLQNRDACFVLFGIFLIIATLEFCELVELKKGIPVIFSCLFYLFFYILSTNNYYLKFVFFKPNTYKLTFLIFSLLVSAKCMFFLFSNKTNKYTLLTKSIYLLGYIILPFYFLTNITFGKYGYNPKILLSVFILIWVNDSFAYLVGKSIGRTKLFERISPKKTIEGFVGGLFFCVLFGYLISKYYIEISNEKLYIWLVIACIIGVFGTIGDLIQSKFKRIAGVKDSGKIMPGHGGVLDRLDSVIFVAPIIYLFFQILYYVS
jgi:phosphatidate cytidylyltransferase